MSNDPASRPPIGILATLKIGCIFLTPIVLIPFLTALAIVFDTPGETKNWPGTFKIVIPATVVAGSFVGYVLALFYYRKYRR